jgi:hypothetical protein
METVKGTKGIPAIHVLVRVVGGPHTVPGHSEMVSRKGAVLFGKMGRPISKQFRDTLNDQIARGVNTFFFLTTREGEGSAPRRLVTHKCKLRHVYNGSLDNAKRRLIPSYYSTFMIDDIRTWFEITSFERATDEEVFNIFTPSTGREIRYALRGTGCVFRVAIRAKEKTEK